MLDIDMQIERRKAVVRSIQALDISDWWKFSNEGQRKLYIIRQLDFTPPTIFSFANTRHIKFNELVWLPAA